MDIALSFIFRRMLCVKHVHQDSSCFLACETHQKAGGHMLTANSGSLEADRSDRSGRPVRPVGPTGQTGLSSCNPSRLRFILEILV